MVIFFSGVASGDWTFFSRGVGVGDLTFFSGDGVRSSFCGVGVVSGVDVSSCCGVGVESLTASVFGESGCGCSSMLSSPFMNTSGSLFWGLFSELFRDIVVYHVGMCIWGKGGACNKHIVKAKIVVVDIVNNKL